MLSGGSGLVVSGGGGGELSFGGSSELSGGNGTLSDGGVMVVSPCNGVESGGASDSTRCSPFEQPQVPSENSTIEAPHSRTAARRTRPSPLTSRVLRIHVVV